MARSPKSIAIESALRHKDTRQAFLDAFNAPVGSTRRKNASTMLKGITKTAYKRFSGQGGADSIQEKNPWARFSLPIATTNHPMKRAPRLPNGRGGNGVSSWSIPGVVQGLGDLYKTSYTETLPKVGEAVGVGLSGLGTALLGAGQAASGFLQQQYTKSFTGKNVPFSETTGGQMAQETFNPNNPVWQRFSSGQTKTPTAQAASGTPSGLTQTSGPSREVPTGGLDLNSLKNTPGLTPYTGTASPNEINQLYQRYFGRDASGAEMQNWQREPTQELESFLIKEQKKYSTSDSLTVPGGTSGTMYGPEAPGDIGTGDETTGGAYDLPSALSGWDRIQSLVSQRAASGLGPQASAIDIMNDPAAMAELQKLFPGVPQELLPKGATLAGQLNDLAELKKKELGLDDLYNKQRELVNEGVSLQSDLTDFVRGKDEYITKIDQLLNNAQENILGRADAADPRVKGQYDAYVGYLTTLKGRQTKRYTDVLNDSIDQHNNDLQRIETLYQDTLTRYNSEITAEAAITQEVYTQMYNSLTELYTQLVTAESNEYDAEMKAIELAKARTDLASSVLKLQGSEAENGNIEKGVAYAKSAGFINPDTGAISGVDVLSGVNDLLANGYDVSAARGFVSSIMNAAISELTSPYDPKTSTETPLEKITRINKALNNLQAFSAGDFSGIQAGYEENADLFNQLNDTYQQYLPQIRAGEESIINSQLDGVSVDIKQALIELFGKKGLFGGKKPMQFAEWKSSKTAQKLPPTVLNMLEKVNEIAEINGTTLQEALGFSGEVTQMSENEIIKAISNAYTATLF